MAEYINLDNALERLLFSMCGTGYQYEAMHTISSMPTIDIVFCKDCKYAYINSFAKVAGTVSCKFWADKSCGTAYTMQQNDFCSYGERKEFYNGKD